MEKSANKRWKESGTSLSFKEWIDRENKKNESQGNFLPFSNIPEPNQIVRDTIQNKVTLGYKPTTEGNKVLGLDSKILIFSGILIVGSLSYYFYNKLKVKK
jgi:hypothetical protein